MQPGSTLPRALPPPDGDLVLIRQQDIDEAVLAARRSPRRRVIKPFHKRDKDPLHRMFNALQPGSYVQPHRHSEPPKAESIIVLRGCLAYVSFTGNGEVDGVFVLRPDGEAFGIDTEPGVFHTFFALEAGTVVYEVKPGPYEPATDKDFAAWAPREGAAEAAEYLAGLERLARQRR